MLAFCLSDPLTCNNALKPRISIPGSPDFKPPCHDGWTVIMRHENPGFSFRQSWSGYKNGFGDTLYDFWIGNALLVQLTKSKLFDLRLEIWTSDGQFYSSEYTKAKIENELKHFSLSTQGHGRGLLNASLLTSGTNFSTYDVNNGFNCSQSHSDSGFWFTSTDCTTGSLTGDLKTNTYLLSERGTKIYAKKVIMKIIPNKANIGE